jgi:hypothetical protein
MLNDLVDKILKGYKEKGRGPAKDLVEILDVCITGKTGTPGFESNFKAEILANTGDVTEVVLLLLLAVLDETNFNMNNWETITDFTKITPGFSSTLPPITVSGSPSPTAIVLAAYLNLIYDERNGAFKDDEVAKVFREKLL